jgi:hypothetical protein
MSSRRDLIGMRVILHGKDRAELERAALITRLSPNASMRRLRDPGLRGPVFLAQGDEDDAEPHRTQAQPKTAR